MGSGWSGDEREAGRPAWARFPLAAAVTAYSGSSSLPGTTQEAELNKIGRALSLMSLVARQVKDDRAAGQLRAAGFGGRRRLMRDGSGVMMLVFGSVARYGVD
jgi:hypothetical protein